MADSENERTLREILHQATEPIPISEAIETIRRRIMDRHEREALDTHLTTEPDMEREGDGGYMPEAEDYLSDILGELSGIAECLRELVNATDTQSDVLRELVNILKENRSGKHVRVASTENTD